MSRIQIVTLFLCALSIPGVAALERIKKAAPNMAKAERSASEQAMNVTTLLKGDIVSTDQGFLFTAASASMDKPLALRASRTLFSKDRSRWTDSFVDGGAKPPHRNGNRSSFDYPADLAADSR